MSGTGTSNVISVNANDPYMGQYTFTYTPQVFQNMSGAITTTNQTAGAPSEAMPNANNVPSSATEQQAAKKDYTNAILIGLGIIAFVMLNR